MRAESHPRETKKFKKIPPSNVVLLLLLFSAVPPHSLSPSSSSPCPRAGEMKNSTTAQYIPRSKEPKSIQTRKLFYAFVKTIPKNPQWRLSRPVGDRCTLSGFWVLPVAFSPARSLSLSLSLPVAHPQLTRLGASTLKKFRGDSGRQHMNSCSEDKESF